MEDNSVKVLAATIERMTRPVHVPWYANLEIWKLLVSLVGPLIALYFGIWITKRVKAFEGRQWANQKLIEKRMALFDETAPLLNDLYCYFVRVGNWKELTPPDIIAHKRRLDKSVYVNAALFSPEFHRAYHTFIHACFRTFTGTQKDAKIRTSIEKRSGLPNWEADWENCFCDDPDRQLAAKYHELMARYSSELGVGM